MKRIIFYISFVLLFATGAIAQIGKGKILKDRIKSQKIAYLSTKLELTEDESIRFWPIYNQYEKELEDVRYDLSKEITFRNMTDGEADKALDALIAFKQKEIDIEKKYISKFRNVLSANKTMNLLYYDKEFRRELVEGVKKRVNQRNNR